MEVNVLLSKNGFLALNKPVGMCTWVNNKSHSSYIPQLWELIQMRYKNGRHVHRIDRFTSGINLAATEEYLVQQMMHDWHDNTKKYYLAIIENPDWVTKVIDVPLNGGKPATTSFTVIERSGRFALVQCQLTKFGRTHQIRQHLMWCKCPIIGDLQYGGLSTDVRAGQLLHAWVMKVRFPGEDVWTKIQAPIPNDFQRFPFDWDRWSKGMSPTVDVWPVPRNWRR